ncbi:hypothetical protein yc1106_01326 [Curvularia clavata]|uniref:Rhodopsin domain-containing protein n=1 Tax=Curvularia clavata TaxID=95742 RepID=A0A9Q8Z0W8_CURCL|nr:hypothetical protein yc1106_01326 [Curvularia clavata]
MTSRFPTAEEFASFPPPNYVNPTNHLPMALGVVVPMTIIVTVFMTCRLYCRTVLVKTLGWDDGLMLIAAVLCVGSNIMLIISMLPEYQMGYHLWDIHPEKLYGANKAAQMGMATQLLFTAIATFMKVAILLTYIRIFPAKLDRWFCHLMIFYTVSLNTACFFVTLFQCSPASTYWRIFEFIGTAKCLNIKAIYYFHSGQNTLSDFIIFLWPARNLINVQVSKRQRFTLIMMFSLGVIVCIAGIVRLYFTHRYLVSFDAFWYGGSTFIIMSIESGVGVACGCLPGCKPLMNKMFPRIFANSSHPSSYPRRSAHFRARKGVQEFSSGARSEQMSYNQKEEDPSAMEKAIRRDTPSTHQAMATSKSLPLHPGIRPPSRAAFPGGRREGYSELDNESEDSIEMFLLQRN